MKIVDITHLHLIFSFSSFISKCVMSLDISPLETGGKAGAPPPRREDVAL